MLLSHDEINTVALLIERKPIGSRTWKDNQLYRRIQTYFIGQIGVCRINVDLDQLNEEERKDQEEERDGRYR